MLEYAVVKVYYKIDCHTFRDVTAFTIMYIFAIGTYGFSMPRTHNQSADL